LTRGLQLASIALLAAPSAHAVDGVIEINQARALQGGVTFGDGAGFPITLSVSGSYRLTGELIVPSTGTTAISVTADRVSIDLNGFSISGPNSCTGGCPVTSCTATSGGSAISGNVRDLSIRNGTIRGMGGAGILSGFGSGRVQGVTLEHNGAGGIAAGTSTMTVTDSRASSNHGIGISSGGGILRNNMAECNKGAGLSLFAGQVSECHAVQNSGDGIAVASEGSIFDNNANNNAVFGIRANNSTVSNNSLDSNHDGIKVTGMGTVIGNSISASTVETLEFASGVGYHSNVMSTVVTCAATGGVSMGENVCNGTRYSFITPCDCIP
jgi:hypothetical protein